MPSVKRIERIVKRGGQVHLIHADETAAAAAKEMRKHKVGCLVVVDEMRHVVGILSERDIITKVVADMASLFSVNVSAIMTVNVISCTLQTDIAAASRLMSRHNMRHLPIIEDGVPVGMISSRDIMAHKLSAARAVVRKQAGLLRDLESDNPGITRIETDSAGRVVI